MEGSEARVERTTEDKVESLRYKEDYEEKGEVKERGQRVRREREERERGGRGEDIVICEMSTVRRGVD